MADAPVYTANDFQAAALALLPSGPVWPKDADSVQAKVAAGLAATYARLTARSAALLQDSPTGALVERLEPWESTLGLPDPCAGAQPTIALRQQSVRARLTAQGGQSVPYFISVAAALGVTATVDEFVPSRLGKFRLGQRMQSARWAHAWRLTSAGTVVTPFRLGSGRLGDRFQTWGSPVLQCEMTRIKPAHTALMLAYTGARPAQVWDAPGVGWA